MKINSKKIIQRIALLLLVPCVSVMGFSPKAFAAATTSAAIVPMYEYPTIGTYWNDILGAGSDTVPFAIVNPANGPGVTVDPIYTSSIATMTSGGTRAVAYVDSSYHARSFQSIIDDIDDWYTMYPDISGIIIDQVQTLSADDLCYTAGLYNHVKSTHPNDLVILNPGTNIPQVYEPYGDIFLNAENTYAAYQSWTPIAGWEDNPAYQNRFWQAIHTVSSGNYNAALALMRANNAGWTYVTDDVMPNPYKTTPSYWSTEETDLDALPNPTVPNRGLTQLPSGCQSLTAATSNTNTLSAKQVKTSSSITVANTDTLYPADAGSKISFTLPTGVTFAATGTNWTCTGNDCSYDAAIAASGNAAVLGAEFTASCDYTSGSVTGVLSNFTGNTSNITPVALTRPADCVAGELANTGLPIGTMGAIAGGMAIVAGAVYVTRTRIHYVHQTVRRRSRW